MKTKFYFLLALLLIGGLQVNAQKTKQCKVTYDVEVIETGEEADPMMASMMKDMTMVLAFQDKAARIEMDMSMMKMVVVADEATKSGVALIDMMGVKMATPMGEEEFGNTDDAVAPEIRETGKTKKIAGHKCYQAFVKDADSDNEVELWYTKNIVVDNTTNEYTYEGIDGFPLEMFVDQDGVKMRMTASSVSTDKMPRSYFSTEVPEGYTVQDPNEMGTGY